MDEWELELYLNAVDAMDPLLRSDPPEGDGAIYEQLRDENGFRVPGCYRTLPTPTQG